MFVLDFPGRSFKASVKNCQLVAWDSSQGHLGAQVLLQFAKMGQRNTYCLDFSYPLSAFQAFAIGAWQLLLAAAVLMLRAALKMGVVVVLVWWLCLALVSRGLGDMFLAGLSLLSAALSARCWSGTVM